MDSDTLFNIKSQTFHVAQEHLHCCPAPEEIDLERVAIHEDRQGFRQRVIQYRFGYDAGEGKMTPLTLCLVHPDFSGKDVHPIVPPVPGVHAFHGFYASASNRNQQLETKLTLFLNKLAEKCDIQLQEHSFMTNHSVVYSVKFDQFLPERFQSIDALTCLPVNGVLVQPVFVEQPDGAWHCHCKIVLACVE